MCWTSRNELTKLIADKDIECLKLFLKQLMIKKLVVLQK